MLIRIKPISENANDYLQLLINNIEQEFEHNLVQQLYVSKETWMAIIAAKTAVSNKLKQVAESSNSANDLRENVLIDYSKTLPPTETAIDFIKSEVKQLL
jgi:dihydrodipicolinate reductase